MNANEAPPAQGGLTRFNTQRTILDAVGSTTLEAIVRDYLALLETSVTIYEVNGDYATGGPPAGWCRLMDTLSRRLCATEDDAQALASGKWLCRRSCWEASRSSIAQAAPTEHPCMSGLLVYSVPIQVKGRVIGCINMGHGQPGADRLETLSQTFGVSVDELRSHLQASSASAPAIAVAKRLLETTARLLGQMVERRLEELEHDHERELFIGMLAHDLRNPLGAVKTGAGLLLQQSQLEPAQRRILARMATSADRMARLISQLLDFTRSRIGGGLPIHWAPCHLEAVIRQVVEETALAHPSGQIHFSAEGDLFVQCDADRVRQAVANLLNNARLHGDPIAPVTVTAIGSRSDVEIQVHNRGSAIPQSARAKLFLPFKKGEMARSEGLGLGLYIAHQVASGHGGEMAVESTEEGGTTFTLRLPRRSP